ncbi:MAG: hypothetical protein V5A88_03535 [Candidatus Thermoplasmatota archaeon]
MKMESGFLFALILSLTVSMSLFSPQNVYRFFPLIFGVLAIVGYLFKKLFLFDIGIFLSFLFYLFANSGLPFDIYNLLAIMAFFFLMMGIWFYSRNVFLISGIEEVADSDGRLSSYKRSSLSEILNTLLMSALLSIVASFIVLYSSLGIAMDSRGETLLMVILSAAVFFITILIVKLLFSQKIKTGSES